MIVIKKKSKIKAKIIKTEGLGKNQITNMKHIKIRSCHMGVRSGEKPNHKYETYKDTVMPHGRHIYAKASDTTKATSHDTFTVW